MPSAQQYPDTAEAVDAALANPSGSDAPFPIYRQSSHALVPPSMRGALLGGDDRDDAARFETPQDLPPLAAIAAARGLEQQQQYQPQSGNAPIQRVRAGDRSARVLKVMPVSPLKPESHSSDSSDFTDDASNRSIGGAISSPLPASMLVHTVAGHQPTFVGVPRAPLPHPPMSPWQQQQQHHHQQQRRATNSNLGRNSNRTPIKHGRSMSDSGSINRDSSQSAHEGGDDDQNGQHEDGSDDASSESRDTTVCGWRCGRPRVWHAFVIVFLEFFAVMATFPAVTPLLNQAFDNDYSKTSWYAHRHAHFTIPLIRTTLIPCFESWFLRRQACLFVSIG